MKLYYFKSESRKKGRGAKYLDMHPKNSENWMNELTASLNIDQMISIVWGDYKPKNKKPGSYAWFSGGPCIRADDFETMKPFCIGNKRFVEFTVENPTLKYVFIDKQNFAEYNHNIPHMFMMRPKYKRTVVTEAFKSAWEANHFTGAEFEYVGELSDDHFIKVI